MTSAVVIAGTDTGIGKTVFASALTCAVNGTYWKPVQSGLDDETDTETAKRLGVRHIIPERYRLHTPCSPHHAAKLDSVTIDLTQLALPKLTSQTPLVIETAGGLLVPLTPESLQIDLIARWDAPVVLCARTELGTINHTLLSLEALNKRAINVIGVAFIGNEDRPAEEAIISFGKARHLGRLPICEPLNEATLKRAFSEHFAGIDQVLNDKSSIEPA